MVEQDYERWKTRVNHRIKSIVTGAMSLLLYVILLAMFIPCREVCAEEREYDYNSVSACWISYLDMEKYLCDVDEEAFTQMVSSMYDKLKIYNINTVIVQVRPMGDAIYPSDYYPVSKYINSKRDISAYDPLTIMIDLAHQRGLRFEAWINPYRLSKDIETTEEYKNLDYYNRYLDFIYSYQNSSGEECLSLDPVRQESIELIINGVCEVVQNYDVDGIHFDDYFFVEGMYEDMPVAERMTYVDSMVSQVYEAIKETDSGCEFGISPSGNINVAREQGVDVDRWLSTPGYIDYIMPQIYWTDNYQTNEGSVKMFTDMSVAWQTINLMDIPIYVGLALYRVGEDSTIDLGWSENDDNLGKSWSIAMESGYDGYALFRYEWFDKETAYKELDNLKNYQNNYIREKNSNIFKMIIGIGANYHLK